LTEKSTTVKRDYMMLTNEQIKISQDYKRAVLTSYPSVVTKILKEKSCIREKLLSILNRERSSAPSAFRIRETDYTF
jgi:hypothetical protein